MLSRIQYLVLCLLGLLAVALVVANGWLATSNRAAQAEINQRQQFLQQTAQLELLYRDIAKGLADLALKSNDRAVLGMLASLGINVSPNPASPPTSAPAPGAAGVPPAPAANR
jgi:hypothetical protein